MMAKRWAILSNRSRWSDNDKYFGPFTYARELHSGRSVAIVLSSGDDDEYPGCDFRLTMLGHTFIVALPQVIKPYRRKVMASSWGKETIERLGRDWYYDTHDRKFGFDVWEGALHLYYGPQTHDSTTTKSGCYFIPWRAWRHIRHSLYDLSGEFFANIPDHKAGKELGQSHSNAWAVRKALTYACPTASFEFNDYDGERITAKTNIEEREWLLGDGCFKWLSWLSKSKIRRSLNIEFSAETGKRKGSWKGGTIGCGIDMQPGELHEAAFKRYCAENNMTFVGPTPTGQ